MAISNQYGDREYKKFVESTDVGGQIGIVVLNPDGSTISGGGGGGSSYQYQDGTAIGAQYGNIMMATDGSNLQFLSSNSSGELNLNNIGGTISLPTGAATETTLNSALTKLTDIETNTDSLAGVTSTTVGADTGLDVNVISGINVEVDLDAADDSVLVYGFDGASNQKIATDASGNLQVDVLTQPALSNSTDSVTAHQGGTWDINDISGTISLPTGAATESTLSSIDTDTTTIAAKVTDIETNTDSLAGLTSTTVGADTGLDVNIIGGVTLEVNLDEANDSVQIYGYDGSSNQAIKTDANGNLQVDLADITSTTIGSDTALDVNVVNSSSTPVTVENVGYETDYFNNLLVGQQYNQVELRLDRSDYADYIDSTSTAGASVSQSGGLVTWSSGTNTSGSTVSTTTLDLDYRPGYGLYAAGTAVFSSGVAGNIRRMGISDDTSFTNSVTIGYEETDFKIRYTRGGSEILSVAQASWDDPCSGAAGSQFTRDGSVETLDPTKANLFRIKAGLFGFAGWVVEVFTPDEKWIPVYTYKNINNGTTPVFTANTFKLIYHNVNSTSTTDSTMTSQCWAGGSSTSLLRVDDSLTDDSLASLNRSVITGRKSTDDGTYVNVKVAPSGSLEVNASQDTHDDLNANVNLQVADTDVSNSNPVPVSDAGGSLTVDNAGLTELAAAINASSQLDINVAADAVGLATESTLSNLDTTATSILADTAAIDTSTASIDTKLTTTNTKLTDIETNTDSLTVVGGGTEATALRVTLANDSTGVLTVDDGGGSLTIDGTVAATQSGTWDINDISGTISLPTGAATESTLNSILTKATDIETNTDALATVTKTTSGADTGLDVNVINTVNTNTTITRQANISNSQTQGTGNISVSIAPGVLFKVIAVYLKFQAVPTANDFDVTIVDLAQPFYNTTVFSVDPGTLGITNVSWVPDGEVMVLPGQTLDLTFTNTATTQFGLTVIYEQIQ